MATLANRVRQNVSGTPGTGTVTLGTAYSNFFFTFVEASIPDGAKVTYVLESGTDFELGQGTYTASGGTLSRDTVLSSKIAGTAGTNKLNLTSNAQVRITALKEDMRELLTADRTYYVTAGIGSDGANGFSSGNAWLTLQHALDVIMNTLDLNGHNVTVEIAGAFTVGISAAGTFVGGGAVIVNSSTSASITTTSQNCIECYGGARLTVQGNITLSTNGPGTNTPQCLTAWSYGYIKFSGLTFGSAIGPHIQAGWLQAVSDQPGLHNLAGPGTIQAVGNYSITGSAQAHLHCTAAGSQINLDNGITITLTGTPAFSAYFVGISAGFVYAFGVTFSGSATGRRYYVHRGGTIVAGSSADRNFFPGSTRGDVIAGGFYVSSDDQLSDLGVQKIVGGNSISSASVSGATLTFQTSNANATNDSFVFLGGNAGATTFAILSAGALQLTASGKLIGGTGTTGTQLTLQSTSGSGTTDQIDFVGGNNGGTSFGRFNVNGFTSTGFVNGMSLGVTGTGGAGFVALTGQSAKPSAVANLRFYADGSVNPAWVKTDGFARILSSGTLTADRSYTLPDASGTFALTVGANIPAIAQGDLLYGSAANTLSMLTKDGGSSRFLKNSGTSNNPAWAQPTAADLSNGTTGTAGAAVVLATSPTLVTPTLGAATATTINKYTFTAPATGATLTIADGKTVTHNATMTFAGADGKTLTISNSGTLSGGDSWTLSIAATKTLTVSESMTLTAGAASQTWTFPSVSDTVACLATAQTFTANQTISNSKLTISGSLTSSTSLDSLLSIATMFTNNGATQSAINVAPTLNGSGDTACGIRMAVNLAPSGSITTAQAFRIVASAQPASTITITNLSSAYATIVYANVAGAVTNGMVVFADTPTYQGGTLKPANQYGVRVSNMGASGITTSYGLYVDAQSGSTTNYMGFFNSANPTTIQVSGGIGVGTTSDPGAGAIYLNQASYLMRNKTSFTNGAGASTGTLTNAPAAGNPTKWIAIDDNGTTRQIPAW